MSYELRRFKSHLKPQNYSNICEQNDIKNVDKSRFVLSPGLLNEEFPALSASSVASFKSYKQNSEHDVFTKSEKSSYSEKLQAKNKSCDSMSYSLYKNDHIESKYNSQSPLNSFECNTTSNTAASNFHSGIYNKSHFKRNEKKGGTDNIFVARNIENSKQNYMDTNFNDSFVEREIVKGNQRVKVSDKATENIKHDKLFQCGVRKTSQKQNIPLQNINYPSRSRSHNNINMKNSFKQTKHNKVKDFDTDASHSKQNSGKVNENHNSKENNIQSVCKNVDINHIKKEPGLMDESLVTGVSTNANVGKKSGRKRKTRKRSNKIKRQTAFQTGKLLILTPDLHSRITRSLAKCDPKPSSNSVVDIDNFDEYPTLGSQSNGTKEQFLKKTSSSLEPFHLKTEIKVEADVDFPVTSDQFVNSASETPAKSFLGNWPSADCISNGDVDSKQLCSNENGKIKDIEKSELVAEKKPSPRQPIQLLDLLTVSKQKGKAKKAIEGPPKHYASKPNDFKVISRGLNVLDSSAPNIKRGKEREKPKQKKLSSLKKIILSERLRKKELKEQRKKECLLAMYSAKKDDFVDSTFGNSNAYVTSTKDNLHIDHASSTKGFIKIEEIEETDNKINLMEAEKNEIIVKAEEHKLPESCKSNEKYFEDKRNLIVQAFIHIKGFREYCNHLLSKELNETTILFIDCLARFQDRQHQKDPVKARMKRRLTYGLKEVTKHLKLRKLKCVVIAPDLEDIQSSGGLNSALAIIIQIAADYHIPCIFAANRKQLGKACHKGVPVSCVGIFSYEGSELLYKKTSELHEKCLKDYQYLKKTISDNLTNENIEEFMLAKENGNIVVMRCKFLKDILCKETEDLELLKKCNSDVYAWFRDHYLLKLSEVP